MLRSLRTSFNCGSPSTLSHAYLPRTALGWTLFCNMKLSHLAFNANPRLPFVKQRAKTQVANVEAGSETELMPPRLALHAGVDRRVAEVQLELVACAGVTWSRVETGSSNRCILPQLQSSVNRIKASVKNRGRGCSARSFLVNQVALVAACSGATPH